MFLRVGSNLGKDFNIRSVARKRGLAQPIDVSFVKGVREGGPYSPPLYKE